MSETANSQSKQTMSSNSENGKELLESLRMLLGCVGHRKAEACSISLVQDQLRKSKVEAYMPQVVSIGPIHKGTRTSLLYMEEIKLCCMKHLFKRTSFEEEICLKKCSISMWKIDQIVRASYVGAVNFNRDELAKIMVIDGCFLLELLISTSPKLNKKLKCSSSENTSPGPEVVKREDVLSDLALLENQIPHIVLHTLCIVLFVKKPDVDAKGKDHKREGEDHKSEGEDHKHEGEDHKHEGEDDERDTTITRLIQESALSIFGYSADVGSGNLRAFHFVQLVHEFVDKELKDVNKSGQVADGKLKLQRCATRLEAAGVTIKPPPRPLDQICVSRRSATEGVTCNKDLNRFDLRIKFKDGELEIPQLHITKTTEAKWRNLIAWELNRTSLEKHQATKEAEKTRCVFICYAWFIQSLVCCVHDVKLLRERKVLVVPVVESVKGKKKMKKIMSDEDLLNLFRKMTEGVCKSEIEMDPWFAELIKKLNRKTRTVNGATGISRVMWHSLRCFITWIWWWCRFAFWSLIHDCIPTGWKLIAVVAAAAGLALTATQTQYSIHPQ